MLLIEGKSQIPFENSKWDTITVYGKDTILSNYQNINILNGKFTEYQRYSYADYKRLFTIVNGELKNGIKTGDWNFYNVSQPVGNPICFMGWSNFIKHVHFGNDSTYVRFKSSYYQPINIEIYTNDSTQVLYVKQFKTDTLYFEENGIIFNLWSESESIPKTIVKPEQVEYVKMIITMENSVVAIKEKLIEIKTAPNKK